MFQRRRPKTRFASGLALIELIYHATVRHIRKSHGNAVVGLLMNILQSLMLVIVFYIMFTVIGLRGNAVRGDFILYILSGIFLFITHNKAISAVMGAEGPTSAMMQHAPMNTIVAVASAALGALYIQVLSLAVILFLYDVIVTKVEVYQPAAAFGMVLLSWLSGCAIGMLFLAARPWFPSATGIISQFYIRANMIASGKMFLANTMPGYIIAMFSWNPLFHTIDQARGFTFINYNPHYSSVLYPIYVSLTCLVIGLMGEFFTRQRASLSWTAGK